MNIAISDLNPTQVYHLMTQSIVPRPIAWVLTENETLPQQNTSEASYNLAPFSYFNAVASDPALLMISIGTKPDGAMKDTLRNIKHHKKLVIHIASEAQLDALNDSSASLSYGKSEICKLGLHTSKLSGFSLPRLTNCAVAFACHLDHIHHVGSAPQNLVFAEIESVYLSDDIATRQAEKQRLNIDADKLQPLSRLGGNEYATFGKTILRKRPL